MTDLDAMINTLELTNAQADELRTELTEFIDKINPMYDEFKMHSFQRLFSGKEPYYLELFIVGNENGVSIEWFKPYFTENEYFAALEILKNKTYNNDSN
jgi:hypothetical protein